MSRLAGKVAVITGGSAGLGLATTRRFVFRDNPGRKSHERQQRAGVAVAHGGRTLPVGQSFVSVVLFAE
ncbi:hypothetical protein OG320_08755 [Microbispora sp. NBC_01189]|uniref:hypothetical protein n=1 Tax=Microbispora sp. NBC_01189 TaxID=2903583 RepID=UPI002E0F57FA|nr:hypothetical protein OG320_08755 [Microbispora sp. NBC_01189]